MVESVCELPPLESHPMEAFLPSLLSSPLPIIIISRERRRELSLIGIMQPRVNRPREGGVVSAETGEEGALLFGAALFHMTFLFSFLSALCQREQDVRASRMSQPRTPLAAATALIIGVCATFAREKESKRRAKWESWRTHSAFRCGSLRLRSEIVANHGCLRQADARGKRHQAPLNLVRPFRPLARSREGRDLCTNRLKL